MCREWILTRNEDGLYRVWENHHPRPTLEKGEWVCKHHYQPMDEGTLDEMEIYLGCELPPLENSTMALLHIKTCVERWGNL